VTQRPNGAVTVDVGAWANLVLGPDGGDGSAELCRPLAQRPDALGLTKGDELTLRVNVALAFPDQDLTRLHARVSVRSSASSKDTAARSLPSTAERAAIDSVQTLLEPLRSLGGEATATEVKVEVRCRVSLR
jgi:hypothetical protein